MTLPPKLVALVDQSVAEVLGTTGAATFRRIEDDDETEHQASGYAATLGFTGSAMRGALVVIASSDLLAATCPQRAFKPRLDEADLADWSGEMANQIVGHLKRLVAGYRVDFDLSTPVVMRGRGLVDMSETRQPPLVLRYEIDGRALVVHATVKLGGGVSFEGEPEATGQAVSGDSFLF